MGKASIEDGRFCIRWLKVARPDPEKTCYRVQPAASNPQRPEDKYLRFLGPEQSYLMEILPGDSNEQGALWAKWERILVDTGSIDARPEMNAIIAAPEDFKGKVLMMQGEFLRMLTPESAEFEAYGLGGYREFKLDGVHDDLFIGGARDFLIFATLTSILRRTGELGMDNDIRMTAKLVLPCTQLLCRDWLGCGTRPG